MCDDLEDSDNNTSERQLADNEWRRLNEAVEKEGFREGIEEGQAATLQLGFDCGYNTAFKYFEITGMFRGLIRAMSLNEREDNFNSDIKNKLSAIEDDIKQLENLLTDFLISTNVVYNGNQNEEVNLTAEIRNLFQTTKDNLIELIECNNLSNLLSQIKDIDFGQ